MDTKFTIEELIDTLERYDHFELHVHHTWRPNHNDFTGKNHQSLQDGMRNFHKNNNGWSDIAQHVTLYPDGTFLTGRGFSRNPASIRGKNGWSGHVPFCVEMIGNFDKGNDKLEGKQLESILRLGKFFDDQGKYIRFHRENSSKTCPGTGVDKSEFMRGVKAVSKKEEKVNTNDVENHWAKDSIEALKENGIMVGYSDGSFKPDQPITRAEMAVVVNRILKEVK